ncbi:hypothetical protein FVP74_05765 [Microbacterium saccharophilum]|uniref:DUF3558 domain-containing protein n=1 Tax=Microbacterium saccharophilum TaxID=1213358 RepID=A0A5C8I4Y8_9MICO|nr:MULTISPECIES: hypothetical protein [Microbacterium]TXK14098.1 hypothetical protein FVP74_05765 [Microbacterium saccharophilum]GEP46644.1 hypothetical protein MSA03_01520 [Microbacterium saccharophilum]SFI26760.1 hypothetical protein SAMN04487751_0765 [Microbacterium saccharophilum]
MPLPRLSRAALPLALGALLFTACTGTPGAQPTEVPTAPAPGADPSPSAVPTTAPVDPADLTCENLIAPDAVAGLEAEGWTSEEGEFAINDLVLDGISCTWARPGDTFDDLVVFGWAPITADEAQEAQEQLESVGWTAQESAEGLYLSEADAQNPDAVGTTYLFGDGWVTMSDTQQGLLLIEQPAR